MRIKQLDIYGYGKWVNQQFQVDQALQLFVGHNEAGKSTLQSFIRSILFGFPTKHKRINQQNRYEPKHNDAYGGRLLLADTKYGDIWVERTQAGLKLTDMDGLGLDNRCLDEILGGLDERLFDNFYAFSLQNLQELANIDADQLNDYFLSIGTVGSDQFLKIAKQFQKDSDNLYRPSGQKRPLNLCLNEYDELAQQVEKAHTQMSRYQGLVKEADQETETIKQIQEEINELELQVRETDKLLNRYDIFLKDKAATRELEELVYTEITEAKAQEVRDALKDNQARQVQTAQLVERVKNLQTELDNLTKLNWAINHSEQRREWLIATQKAKESQLNLEAVISRIQEQNLMMQELARQGQFFPEKVSQDQAYQERVNLGLDIQTELIELKQEQESLKAERKVYLDQRKQQQNYTAVVRQQIAKLEAQRMNEEAHLMEVTNLKHYFFGMLFFIVGLCIVAYAWLNRNDISSLFLWAGAAFALIGLIGLIFVFVQNRQAYRTFHQSPVVGKIKELKDKEQTYHEQSKELGTQINHLEESLLSIEGQINQNSNKKAKWLADIGFYPTADADIILKTNPVQQYFSAKDTRDQLETQKYDLITKLQDWQVLIQPLLDRFPLEDESIRQQIRHVEDTEVSLSRTQDRGAVISDKIKETQAEITQLNEISTKVQTEIEAEFQRTQAIDEIDYFKKVDANNRMNELKEKHDFYQEQMTGYETALAEIENKQSLVEKYHRQEHQLLTAKERLTPHQHNLANLMVEIKFIEQDGTYQEKVQALENKKNEIKELIQAWGQRRVAMTLIHQTLSQGIDNPIPAMLDRVNEIFAALSYGRYTQVHLNQKGVRVKQFSDILFEPHELSQGTLEQLYVALRLAFIQSVQSMVKLPILIDDAFVNFDEQRKASMFKVLEEISADHQILFFTFDPQAKEAFTRRQQIDLDTHDKSISLSPEESEKI